MKNIKELLKFSKDLSKETGKMVLDASKKGAFEVDFKGKNNLVTSIDIAAEKMIVKAISKTYPAHAILAEEGGENDKKHDYRWIIDPIDGTTNFAHKIPFYAVSIGLEYRGEIIVGSVYAPYLKEHFWASKGGGAYFNGKKIEVSGTKKVADAVVATGFPPRYREKNLENFRRIIFESQAVRRCGAATIDLCYVACGRFDAFWELGLHPWDIAAGSLILQEAEGKITNLDGSPLKLDGRKMIASNGIIHDEIEELLSTQ